MSNTRFKPHATVLSGSYYGKMDIFIFETFFLFNFNNKIKRTNLTFSESNIALIWNISYTFLAELLIIDYW